MLKDKGIADAEISTSVDVTDLQADSYSSERTPYRYRISSVVTVNTGKVDTVLALLKEQSSLIQKGWQLRLAITVIRAFSLNIRD